jgi:hypothetical protein
MPSCGHISMVFSRNALLLLHAICKYAPTATLLTACGQRARHISSQHEDKSFCSNYCVYILVNKLITAKLLWQWYWDVKRIFFRFSSGVWQSHRAGGLKGLMIDEYGATVKRSLTGENRSDRRKSFRSATKSTHTNELHWDWTRTYAVKTGDRLNGLRRFTETNIRLSACDTVFI